MWARAGRGTLCGVALGFLPLLAGCFLLEEEQDVDGDGLDDVLVGAYGSDAGGNYAGGAWLLRPEAL